MSGVFQPITFSTNEDIDEDTMNILASNDQWLYDNMPQGFYSVNGISKNTNLKMAGGIITVGPTKAKTIYKEVGFGNFFSASSLPIVTATHTGNHRAFITIGGIGSGNIKPDNRGFSFNLTADPVTATKNYFPNAINVHFIAFGW